ncbi:MAG: hypothetical protein ACK4N4_03600 [Burkholderiales bacterium]
MAIMPAPCPEISIGEKVAFLGRPDAYPQRPQQVEVIETHMSWVFLAGQFVYKLKKPVRHDFLDFSTVAARRLNCEREVQLNRRLAGDVYRRVVPLTVESDGTLRLEGTGAVVDWLVEMRRLPADRMLDVAIRNHTLGADELQKLGDTLVDFYRHATPVPMDAGDYRQRFEKSIRVNRGELSRPESALDTEQIERLTRCQLDFVAARGDLLERRATAGKIVDAHGDLRPEHICLTPEPVIIDCLEFNREFRLLDPVDELAYLAMECERLGAAALGDRILHCYLEATADPAPLPLIAFYKAFRACLRAKIAIWHLADREVRDGDKWRCRARDYLELAERHLCHG